MNAYGGPCPSSVIFFNTEKINMPLKRTSLGYVPAIFHSFRLTF